VERATVHGVHASVTAVKITVTGVPDHAAATAAVFRVIALRNVIPGMVSQNPTGAPTGRTTIAFTVARPAGPVVLGALRTARTRIGFHRVNLEDDVAVITLTGAGLRTDPVVPATFCEVLAREGVRMEIVSFENSRISATCGRHELETVVRALREVFEIGALRPGESGVDRVRSDERRYGARRPGARPSVPRQVLP
jgi:aspartate kinase